MVLVFSGRCDETEGNSRKSLPLGQRDGSEGEGYPGLRAYEFKPWDLRGESGWQITQDRQLTEGQQVGDNLTHKAMALVPTEMPNGQAAKDYEADAELQRDEDGGPLDGDLTDEEKVKVDDDALTNEERTFLEQFHSWKENEKKCIRTLYAIANYIDKSHQKATKTKVAATSASVVSGAMCLLGLMLAPTTLGGSLMLTAAGQGLGAVAGVTNIVTNVRENSRNKKALAQANSIIPTNDQEFKEVKGEKTPYVTATGEVVYKCGRAWEIIKKHIRALRLTKTQPHVTSAAKKLMTSGQVSARSGRQVRKAFGGTALAMTKNTLMMERLASLYFLGRDICALSEDWKDLKAGRPTDLAKLLRTRAQEQEQVVEEKNRCYEKLKKRLEKRSAKSSLKGVTGTQRCPLSSLEKARSRRQRRRAETEAVGL
ncbi:apolipoprotein L6 isoform X1 [Psammomys obesus]|uniref:apolipoprotein L6 isoform X1 n=2 Tax=Psammomys obesus TaxID=48139 RepID=UPI0024531920|nr:apolipoprotein L6 isoform X1 [Psammomys obesus]